MGMVIIKAKTLSSAKKLARQQNISDKKESKKNMFFRPIHRIVVSSGRLKSRAKKHNKLNSYTFKTRRI